jgi:hypothetical protein
MRVHLGTSPQAESSQHFLVTDDGMQYFPDGRADLEGRGGLAGRGGLEGRGGLLNEYRQSTNIGGLLNEYRPLTSLNQASGDFNSIVGTSMNQAGQPRHLVDHLADAVSRGLGFQSGGSFESQSGGGVGGGGVGVAGSVSGSVVVAGSTQLGPGIVGGSAAGSAAAGSGLNPGSSSALNSILGVVLGGLLAGTVCVLSPDHLAPVASMSVVHVKGQR